MGAELQSLLERIQKDGVDKAQAEADTILSEAGRRAEEIKAEAEQQAKAIIEQARKDGEDFAERGRKSVEQAGRDVVLTVQDSITDTFRALVEREVGRVLSSDALREMLSAAVATYFKGEAEGARAEILVAPEQQKQITDFLVRKYGEELRDGIEIGGDDRLVSGFKVSAKGENVQHDLSGEAITDALCALLRPHLAAIVHAGQS
jgi:V/A-type H+-transporting ATPase subunit E